jgi:hypothetical protein
MTMTPMQVMFNAIQKDIAAVQLQTQVITQRSERSETAGGAVSYTFANRPRAATGGMSNGTAYVDVAWISNGRKPSEGAGVGTGVLCVYAPLPTDDWLRIGDYSIVQI